LSEIDPLEGASLKLMRARDHLATLKDEYSAFCARDPVRVTMQYENREYPQTTIDEYAVFRAHIDENPPSHWSVIVGDVLQNARAALEHLAWQLARKEHGGRGPKECETGFPMLTKDPDSDNGAKRTWQRSVGRIGERAQEEIKKLQPYQRGYEAKRDLLWILHDLARVDRHRVLHVVAAAWTVPGMSISLQPPSTPGGGAHIVPADINDELFESISRGSASLDLIVDGAEMASGNTLKSISPEYRRRTITFDASYFVAFSESEVECATGLPMTETLERILHRIEGGVLPRFRKHV
jgi:hypothetical protein